MDKKILLWIGYVIGIIILALATLMYWGYLVEYPIGLILIIAVPCIGLYFLLRKKKVIEPNRETVKKRVQKKIRIGYWIGAGLILIAVSFGKDGMPILVIAIIGMILWKFVHRFFWEKFAGNSVVCYECKTEIDLNDRWECPNCKDITRRHVASFCPSCKGVMASLSCPSCDTTLTVHPK